MLLLVSIGVFLVVSSLPGKETLLWAAAILISLLLVWRRSAQLALPRDLLHLLLFPFLLLCVNLHGIYSHPLPDFLKDCWYFTLPLVYLSFGYLAFERIGRWQPLMQPMILAGFGIGVYSLLNAAINRGQLAQAATVDAYRAVTGGGTFVPLVPLVLVLLARRAGLLPVGVERWKTARVLIYAVATAAILVTFSRTHILMLVAGVACTLNFRTALRRLVQSGGLVMLFALFAVGAATYFVAQAKSGPLELFLTKVMHSTSEVQVRAYETFTDINNNWRGYEAYRASRTFAAYSMPDKLFGGGGGSVVDLGFAMQLSPTQFFQYVPVLHNGYMYILVKTGICGLLLFAGFILQMLLLGRRALRLRDPEALFAGLALLWTPLVMVATQGVITGIYNKGELIPILFLAGAAAASYSQRRRVLEAAALEFVAIPVAFSGPGWRPAAARAEGTR